MNRSFVFYNKRTIEKKKRFLYGIALEKNQMALSISFGNKSFKTISTFTLTNTLLLLQWPSNHPLKFYPPVIPLIILPTAYAMVEEKLKRYPPPFPILIWDLFHLLQKLMLRLLLFGGEILLRFILYFSGYLFFFFWVPVFSSWHEIEVDQILLGFFCVSCVYDSFLWIQGV